MNLHITYFSRLNKIILLIVLCILSFTNSIFEERKKGERKEGREGGKKGERNLAKT
jgi:hypothetical protein